MAKLRVGIVGCGEATQILHLPSLYQLANRFAVTALCDASQVVLQGVGDHWHVPKRFLNYRDLVKQDDVDIVLIANPNALHAEVTVAAINSGKHVLVEKPMCMTVQEADEIIATYRKAGVIVQVGHMRRYAPAFTKACDLVKQMGDIRLARVHDLIGHNSLIIGATSRVIRGTDISGEAHAYASRLNDSLMQQAIGDVSLALRNAYGLLLGLSTHDISAMRELLGMPNWVLYAAQRRNGQYLTAAFDYGSYVCHFETGVDNLARFDAALEVYGENTVVHVQYDTPYVRNLPIRLTVHSAKQAGLTEQIDHPAWGDAFVIEWEALYDNITSGHIPKTSPEDFRKDLEIFKAMIDRME